MEVENARIAETKLGYEGHGIFATSVSFEGAGWGQGTGARRADMAFVKAMCDVVGVQSWEQLKGNLVRIRRQSGRSSPIEAVGNAIADRWYVLPS